VFDKSFETIDDAGSGLIPSDDALQAFLQKHVSEHDEEEEEEPAEDAETTGA